MIIFSNSTNVLVIGSTYPQSQHMSKDYPNNIKGSIQCINYDKPINYEPFLKSFQLEHRAKLTDNISSASGGSFLLISEKLLNIFLASNIEYYQYFEANVIHRKRDHKYYFFFIYEQSYNLIDYKNMVFHGVSNPPYSDFYRQPHEQEGVKRKEIKVESPSQIENWSKLYPDYPKLEYEFLKLNHENIHVDMIRPPLTVYYLVSEELKNKIEAAKCTGIDFRTKDWRERPIL